MYKCLGCAHELSSEYLHDKVLAPSDELILCVNYRLEEPEILKYKHDQGGKKQIWIDEISDLSVSDKLFVCDLWLSFIPIYQNEVFCLDSDIRFTEYKKPHLPKLQGLGWVKALERSERFD